MYFHWKYQADKNLVQRDDFRTIVRPGAFSEEPGTGKLSIGRTHVTGSIPVGGCSVRLCLLINCADDREMMLSKSWCYCWIGMMLVDLQLTLLVVERLRLKGFWML